LVLKASAAFTKAPSWEQFVDTVRPSSDLHPDVRHVKHKAASLIDRLRRRGAPATLMSAPWSSQRKGAAIARGPHKSAHDHAAFLREEFSEFIRKQQWTLLPAWQVEHFANLRLSPIGVVPQRDRRPRVIVDYSFFDVNHDTATLAPQEAMQFGKALHRLIHHIVCAHPRHGPVYMSKVDIADGFYRVWVSASHIPQLGVLFPKSLGEEQLVAFPLVLPMGWKNSPPYFSAITETVADLTNDATKANTSPPPHRLEGVAQTPVPAQLTGPGTSAEHALLPVPLRRRHHHFTHQPLAYTDVYVDDFIQLVQGPPPKRRQVQRQLLHTLDTVLRPLAASDHPHRQEPASVKKFLKGDGTFLTRKIVLGWLIDTVAMTIELPPHRVARLNEILASIGPERTRIALKAWQQVLGELRSMALGIPGAKGLFSTLQAAFKQPADRGRLRLTPEIHDFLDDFRWLARDLSRRRTRLPELVPQPPLSVGACDASGLGMGGVHFLHGHNGQVQPLLWRQRFAPHISAALVSTHNPMGTVNNSDLELAGTIAHHDTLVHAIDMREQTCHTLCDNTPAVAWQRKGSTSTMGPAAYLLRVQALHQRFYRYVSRIDHIPGVVNAMADAASRRWELTDSQLVSFFNSTYPQSTPWTQCTLRPHMDSALTSALCKTRSEPESYLAAPGPPTSTGSSGKAFATASTSMASLPASRTRSPSSKSLALATATAALPPATTLSDLAQWRTPYARWARCSPGWGPRISGRLLRAL
jgi:hypothetical protein